MSEDPDDHSEEHGIVVQFFDLNDPLSKFKSLLEQLWHVSLKEYSIWLQGTQQLDESKNLIEHGIEGEGKVQIKLQIEETDEVKMINILDVLKPAEEDVCDGSDTENADESENTEPSRANKCVQWVESKEFNLERLRRGIPSDLKDWNTEDVEYWISWAVKTFDLKNVNLEDWKITGEQVSCITIDEYKSLVPCDPNGFFWTHLQVLQKCGQVAVSLDQEKQKDESSMSKVLYNNRICYPTNISLWKFLLELLTDKAHVNIIQWTNDDGEFHMLRPDVIAQLWGEKKQKSNMTYEKLSRSLRYYYEGDMISKVPGKRFVYKFHCNVKEAIGYSPMEMSRILTEK